jgi:hypothetical protein
VFSRLVTSGAVNKPLVYNDIMLRLFLVVSPLQIYAWNSSAFLFLPLCVFFHVAIASLMCPEALAARTSTCLNFALSCAFFFPCSRYTSRYWLPKIAHLYVINLLSVCIFVHTPTHARTHASVQPKPCRYTSERWPFTRSTLDPTIQRSPIHSPTWQSCTWNRWVWSLLLA